MTEDTGLEMIQIASEASDAVFDEFAARGWGDGLPLVPPTEGRVSAMLEPLGDVDPDEVLATLPPRFGLATRRIVAVNAVVAGCEPAVMPVLVSAVRAMGEDSLNLRGVNATTHPVAPLLIVHGEVAQSAGYNAELGAFGPGNRANATTGRAIRLILMHVAGARPGDGDASTQGGPAKYTYCVAENLAATPWQGYAVDLGIDAPSAITLHCGEAPHNVHDMTAEAPAEILDKCASAMTSLGQNNAPISQAEYFVALCPEHAEVAARHGWTRRHISLYLYRRAAMRVGMLRRAFDQRAWSPWQEALDDGDLVSMTEHPDNIKVFVVGGAGKHSSIIPSWGMTSSVTMAVEA